MLRWTNPVQSDGSGEVFIWTDRGRPEAIRQEDVGRVARERAVDIDQEWQGDGVRDERFVAAFEEVLRTQLPLERLGERAVSEDLFRNGNRRRREFGLSLGLGNNGGGHDHPFRRKVVLARQKTEFLHIAGGWSTA